MFVREQMQIVGIVVGSIVPDSPPLVYCLYTNTLQERTTEVIEFSQYDTRKEILKILKLTLGTKILNVWDNAGFPVWSYIQLDKRFPTHKLAYWSLPITVYFTQWSLHCDV